MEQGGTGYIEAVRRKAPLLIGFSVALALLAWAVAGSVKPAHQVYFSYLVSLAQREEAQEYRFDGYYAIQATDLFTATLARWISTPEVIKAAYEQAGVEITNEDPRSLTRTVRAEKTAPQLVEVRVESSDPVQAEKIAQGLMSVMDRNIDTYHDQGIPALQFRVVSTEPLQGSTAIAKNVIACAVFFLVLFLGINAVLLIEATKQVNQATTPTAEPGHKENKQTVGW